MEKSKMKAVLKKVPEPGAAIEEVNIPKPKAGEVLVKVKAASICGTDKHIYEWNEWAASRIKPPLIFGHEFAGEVVEVGESVKKIKVGNHVSGETHISCGHCPQCLSGNQHVCDNLKILGVDVNGAFAEYVVIPEENAWRNEKDLPWEIAAIQEPLGNAVHAVMESQVSAKNILVIGDGPIAAISCQVARAVGAAKILALGKHEFRLNILKKMGADKLFKAQDGNLEEILKREAGRLGINVVIEMTGSQNGIDLGLRTINNLGTFVAFGIPKAKITLDYANNMVFKGVKIISIIGRKMFETWFQLSNLLNNKRIDISPLITHKLPFSRFEEGMQKVLSKDRKVGKVIFLFN